MFYKKSRRGQGKSKKSKFYPYRSGLEKRLAEGHLKNLDFEPDGSKVEYFIPHKYNPDFIHKKYPNVLIEVKGYFEDSSEASKYVHIAKCNPGKELIFILSDPYKKAYPSCKPRKDGSVQTLADWCKKHNFLFYPVEEIPKEIREGKTTKKWITQEKSERGYKI